MNGKKELSEENVNGNPFNQFGKWYQEHLSFGLAIPESVSLGTATPDGRVSVRTVLLKNFDETGFVFFTNYDSWKSVQLLSNNHAALLFYWSESGRQVRIEGLAHKVSEDESVDYFKTRPRESQLAAWASQQSHSVPGRKYLEKRYETFQRKFKNKDVTKPPFWGGFRLVPSWFEFWEEGPNRMHYRISYSFRNNNWTITTLAP
jgi:pyridoxamine 5'-phosphate oxidase